ncbi:tetratricopeptide repeat protein [Bacteroidota bacterium]
MKRLFFIFLINAVLLSMTHAQRANVLAAYQLIENGKYAEAKEAIEKATMDAKTRKWSRTWYARGLLCTEAYEQGVKDNDKKKYELYPDQLYVALESFEKALVFSKSERIREQIKPHYVNLANEFLSLGTTHYKKKEFPEAVRAFEKGLQINQSEILAVALDTNLLYNTAIAAYQGKDLITAQKLFSRLNELNFSSNVTHLMYTIHMHEGDSTEAREVLSEGIEKYNFDEDLVLILTDLLYKMDATDDAISLLDRAIKADSSNFTFFYTKALVYQKMEQYSDAIRTFKKAALLDPEHADTYKNMGICYYNISVGYDENAMTISNNRLYQEEKARSIQSSKEAVRWLEKAYALNPSDISVREMLSELYNSLNMKDKLNRL